MDEKSSDVMEALDMILEDLTPAQLQRLKELANEIKDPTNMKAREANKIIEELGIDIEAIQKKNKTKIQVNKKPKIGGNEKCPCNSGKKWKKCCMLKL